MKLIVAVAVAILLGSCNDRAAKPADLMGRLQAGNLSRDDLQHVTSAFPGMTKACIARIRVNGVNAFPNRTEDCFEMTPRQRWTGLWRAAFEGSQFCADEAGVPAKKCEYDEGRAAIWFEPGRDYAPDGTLYRVEFVGRRTVHPGVFGHMGVFQHEMIVDRMIAMKRVPEM